MRAKRLAMAGAVVASLAAVPASAYVRTRTDLGAAMCWCAPSDIPIQILTQTVPKNVDATLMIQSSSEAAAVWGRDAVGCSRVKMRTLPAQALTPIVANDGTNRVFFRSEAWTHEAGALAITSVFAIKQTGRILDTDIEINGVNFNWGDLVANPDARKNNAQDIQNTLTHELGHVLGLDHPCTLSANATNSQGNPYYDDKGVRVPTCSTASATIREATMFASVLPGDTERRTLADDDIRATCEIYPVDQPSQCGCDGTEGTGERGGCAFGGPFGGSPQNGFVAALLVLAGLALARTLRHRERVRITSKRR